jgi:hypothetical protein
LIPLLLLMQFYDNDFKKTRKLMRLPLKTIFSSTTPED